MRRELPPGILTVLMLAVTAAGCGDDEAVARPPGIQAAGAGGACDPRTCEELEFTCGEADDGCGTTLECGAPCSSGQGAAGGAGPVDCAEEILAAPVRYGRRARSSGFEGGDEDYVELFDLACTEAATCIDECTTRAGTDEMCAASECLPDAQGGSACVPPGIWGSLEGILAEDDSVLDMSQIVLTSTAYRDALLVDDFGLDVPEGAHIRGIAVEVRRAGDFSVVDDSVRLLKSGERAGAERGTPDEWSEEPGWVSYGGEDDDWGESWSPADLNAEGFGVALSAQYTEAAGNTRAYVDQVRVTISYSLCP